MLKTEKVLKEFFKRERREISVNGADAYDFYQKWLEEDKKVEAKAMIKRSFWEMDKDPEKRTKDFQNAKAAVEQKYLRKLQLEG